LCGLGHRHPFTVVSSKPEKHIAIVTLFVALVIKSSITHLAIICIFSSGKVVFSVCNHLEDDLIIIIIIIIIIINFIWGRLSKHPRTPYRGKTGQT